MGCCSQSSQMSFEEVDKHIDTHAALFTAGKPLDPAAAALQICPTYKAVKPILTLMLSFPFFPAKWKTAIQGLMGILDVICP